MKTLNGVSVSVNKSIFDGVSVNFVKKIKITKKAKIELKVAFHNAYIYVYIEIEKVDVFCKVLNKQFIERLRAISIINKTQLQTPTDCFTPWGDLGPPDDPPRGETVCRGL